MKKTIIYLFTLLIGVVAFYSCDDPYAGQEIAAPTIYEQEALQDANFKASVLTNPLAITKDNIDKTFSFLKIDSKPTLLDASAHIEYKVMVANAEADFAANKYKFIPVTVGGASGADLLANYKAVNDTLKALTLMVGEHPAFARVLAYVVSGGTRALYTTSNLPFKVTTLNYSPVAVDDVANMPQSGSVTISVLSNDTDPEGDVLTVTAVTNGAHGTVKISADAKKVIYTPNSGYSGTDKFTYTISDPSGNKSTANVELVVPKYPENVYMIGQEFGGWDWKNATIVEMTPVNGNPGKFWAVRYFADPKNGFKWCTVRDWVGDFFSLGTDVGFTTHDGNAFVSAAGFYIVLVDYTQKTITLEPAQVYGMGTTFGGWDTGKYPFVANGNVMKLTTTAAGELRMYANSSAAGVGGDWWRMEFVILDGKIAYRGNGGDQTRVPVTAGQVVTLDFNNNTGTIQ